MALCLYAPASMAYVDPGLLGTLYQAAYALVFGALAAALFRPWHYLKTLLRRRSGTGQPGAAEPPAPGRDRDESAGS